MPTRLQKALKTVIERMRRGDAMHLQGVKHWLGAPKSLFHKGIFESNSENPDQPKGLLRASEQRNICSISMGRSRKRNQGHNFRAFWSLLSRMGLIWLEWYLVLIVSGIEDQLLCNIDHQFVRIAIVCVSKPTKSCLSPQSRHQTKIASSSPLLLVSFPPCRVLVRSAAGSYSNLSVIPLWISLVKERFDTLFVIFKFEHVLVTFLLKREALRQS